MGSFHAFSYLKKKISTNYTENLTLLFIPGKDTLIILGCFLFIVIIFPVFGKFGTVPVTLTTFLFTVTIFGTFDFA